MRPNYKNAIYWIAENDEPTSTDVKEISELLSTCLVADLWGKTSEEVAADVVKYKVNKDQPKPIRASRKKPTDSNQLEGWIRVIQGQHR